MANSKPQLHILLPNIPKTNIDPELPSPMKLFCPTSRHGSAVRHIRAAILDRPAGPRLGRDEGSPADDVERTTCAM